MFELFFVVSIFEILDDMYIPYTRPIFKHVTATAKTNKNSVKPIINSDYFRKLNMSDYDKLLTSNCYIKY